MEQLLIGFLIGTITSLIAIKRETSAKDRQIILQLQIENSLHRIDKAATRIRIRKNEKNIQTLFENDNFRKNQILTCLEWLGEITRIRNEKDLQTLIVASDRFRRANKLTENELKKEDTYISE